jgi:hypothetical protein
MGGATARATACLGELASQHPCSSRRVIARDQTRLGCTEQRRAREALHLLAPDPHLYVLGLCVSVVCELPAARTMSRPSGSGAPLGSSGLPRPAAAPGASRFGFGAPAARVPSAGAPAAQARPSAMPVGARSSLAAPSAGAGKRSASVAGLGDSQAPGERRTPWLPPAQC